MRIEGTQCVAFWAILSHLELVSQTIERPFQEVSPEEALKKFNARLKTMSSDEVLMTFVKAGILTQTGEVCEPYKDVIVTSSRPVTAK